MSDDLVKRYRQLQEVIGGCHDGYCVVRKPKGMHTNGGCTCLEDLRLHERSRIGHLLRCAQGMADRIEELEAELHLLKTSGIAEVAVRNQNVMEYMRHWEGRAEAAEAELEKQLKIAAANEESEGAASFRVSRFMYEMTGGKDE